jgi:hypothetical protein
MAVQQQKSRTEKARTPAAVVAAAAPEPGRSISTYRVGKIAAAGNQALCIVRMISPAAIALDIEVPFEGAADASLEIGKERVTGALAFVAGKRAELRPDCEIDPEAILADPGAVAGVGRRALPRVEVDARVRIEVMGQSMSARLCDISTDGVKVLVDDLLCAGDKVVLTLRGLPMRLAAQVRWSHGDHAGVEFDQPLPIGLLNLWLAAQAAPTGEPDWGLVSRS